MKHFRHSCTPHHSAQSQNLHFTLLVSNENWQTWVILLPTNDILVGLSPTMVVRPTLIITGPVVLPGYAIDLMLTSYEDSAFVKICIANICSGNEWGGFISNFDYPVQCEL